MTVLVTGISGMIGNRVGRRLADAGRKVVGMDLVLPPEGAPFPLMQADIGDAHRLHAAIRAHGVERIVHCGAVSGPMVMRDDPHRVLEINIGGTMNVMEAARLNGVRRVVFLSSINAYGGRAGDDLVREDAPLLAANPYGASKVAGEAILRAYKAEHGVDGVSLRLGAVYGPRRTTDCLVRRLIIDGIAGIPTRLPYGAGHHRQYTFHDDAADGIIAALDRPGLPQAAYNITGGTWLTVEEVGAVVAAVVPGCRLEVGQEPYPNDRPIGPLDISAAARDLGYRPKTPLADGVATYAEWLRERHGDVMLT